MELRVLRYFVAVVQEQNIIRAAKSLHLTQPTLSRQLMDLEAELGCKLFTRSNRQISLTTQGHFLYKHAQEILALVDKTTAQFKEPEEIISGNIFIGCAETEAMRSVAKVMKKINSKYPQVQFHLYSGNADEITAKLDSGVYDFAILSDYDMKKYNYIRLLTKNCWGVLMRKDSPTAKLNRITPQILWDLPLIVSNQSAVDSKIAGWIEKDMKELNIVASYNLINNASILAEEGLGYVLCFDKLINTTGDSNLCFRPLYPSLDTNIHIAWKKNQVFTKQAKVFLDCLQTYLKEQQDNSLI